MARVILAHHYTDPDGENHAPLETLDLDDPGLATSLVSAGIANWPSREEAEAAGDPGGRTTEDVERAGEAMAAGAERAAQIAAEDRASERPSLATGGPSGPGPYGSTDSPDET